jgi:peptide/nickel transport system ATP-binding protein
MDKKIPILSVNNLEVGFELPEGRMMAVKKASFDIFPGKTLALVGESGSGKSVISQTVMGLLPSQAKIYGGSILFSPNPSDKPVIDIAALNPSGKTIRDIRGGQISIIFQEPMTSLSPLHTIGNQILEALMLHRHLNPGEAVQVVIDMLRLVGFPDPKRGFRTYPFELSGGLRQRSMIAMALICRPCLLIADEPTTALDVTIQAQILKLMKDLQAEFEMALLMITHDLGVVANMADDVVVMYRGEIMETGSVEDIFKRAEHPYLKSLMAAVPRFDMGEEERLIPIRNIESKSSPLLKPNPKDLEVEKTLSMKPVLTVQGIRKSFSIRSSGIFNFGGEKVSAVDGVSFKIRRGSCLGLVGESGCGKTTLSKIIMRAVSPDAGSIQYSDQDGTVDILSLNEKSLINFRKKIQFIFQDPFSSLNPRMTVFDIISEPLIIHDIGDHEFRITLVRELIRLVGLDIRHLNRYPHSFSGGQRQRIGIARALALKPRLLICDEPVSALDVSIQAQVLNLLRDLKEQLALSYLFVSHNLAVIDYIADDVAVMCAGQIVEAAPRATLFKNPVHPYTKALFSAVPSPSIEKPLDFEGIMDERCSDPTEWDYPFTVKENIPTKLLDIGGEHFVRVHQTISELKIAS